MVVAVYVCLVTKHKYNKNPLSWALLKLLQVLG